QRGKHVEQAGAGVHVRGAAETDDEAWRLHPREQLAEPTARRRERIQPAGVEWDDLRGLDDERVVEPTDERQPRTSERVVHVVVAELVPAERCDGSLAAV